MSRNPSSSSSSLIRLLTTEGRVRSSAAALVKLRRWATRTNVLSLFRSRSAAVNDIVVASRRVGEPDSGSAAADSSSTAGPSATFREQQLFRDRTYTSERPRLYTL